MMVEVFISPRATLLRRERSKKWMWMFCALRFPALMKLADTNFELFSFPAEIPQIGNHQFLVGWVIPGKRLIVAIDGPDEWPDQPADQNARPHQPTGSKIETRGAMRHHLSD